MWNVEEVIAWLGRFYNDDLVVISGGDSLAVYSMIGVIQLVGDGDEPGHPPAPSTVQHEENGGDEHDGALPGAHRVNRGVGEP